MSPPASCPPDRRSTSRPFCPPPISPSPSLPPMPSAPMAIPPNRNSSSMRLNQPASIRYLNVLKPPMPAAPMVPAVAFQSSGSATLPPAAPLAINRPPPISNAGTLPPAPSTRRQHRLRRSRRRQPRRPVHPNPRPFQRRRLPGPRLGDPAIPHRTRAQHRLLRMLGPHPLPQRRSALHEVALNPTPGCTTIPSDSSGTLAFPAQ